MAIDTVEERRCIAGNMPLPDGSISLSDRRQVAGNYLSYASMLVPMDVTLEVEALGERGLTFPLASLVETEVVGARKLTMPLSALVELEVAGKRALTFPLDATVEVEVEGERALAKRVRIDLKVRVNLEYFLEWISIVHGEVKGQGATGYVVGQAK